MGLPVLGLQRLLYEKKKGGGKKPSVKYVSNVNQKVHESQYCLYTQRNSKEDAKLSPASPAERMACQWHPNALSSAAEMDFEASSSGLGFGATIST